MAGTGQVAGAVLALLRTVPLLLVLDGLESTEARPEKDSVTYWMASCARC